jgi:hypothetical protein
MNLLAITHHDAVRIGELGFLLGAVAGVLFVLGAAGSGKKFWNTLAGLALAGGSVLLIVAAHWGHFG